MSSFEEDGHKACRAKKCDNREEKERTAKTEGFLKPSRDSSADLGGRAVHMKKTALMKGWGGEGDKLDRHRVAEGL